MNDTIIDSRIRIRKALDQAFGVYEHEEAKKADSWRKIPLWNLIKHAEHELEEIRSSPKDRQHHNCLDLINLGAIMASKLELDEENLKQKQNSSKQTAGSEK